MEYSDRSGPTLQGLSPAEVEAKMKEQAAIQAMMDDLGSARLDQLPLDDGPKASKHARHYHNARSSTQHRQPSAPTTSLGDVWRDAIAAGAFDDEDAEGVKNLDDLGGGRIYDNASTCQSREHRVVDVTMRILDQRSSSSARQRAESAAQRWQTRHDMNQVITASSSRANNGWEPVPSTSARPQPAAINPMMRPARLRPPPVVPSLPVPIPEVVTTPDAPLPFDVTDVLFKTEANFLSRDVHPAMRSVIILSAAKRPELGFFTVALFNRKYCQWAMSAWYDYSSGADNLLGATFQDGSTLHSYHIFFGTSSDLMDFVETVRSILAENDVALVDSASISASAPPLAAASSGLASAVTRADRAVGATCPQDTSTETRVARSTTPATHCSAADSKPHVNAKPLVTPKPVVDSNTALARAASPASSVAPASHSRATVLPTENRCVGEDVSDADATADSHCNTVLAPHSLRQQNTPVRQANVLETSKMKQHAAAGTATDEHEAEATNLLSTLQSYRHNNSADIDESSMRMFRNIVSATARLFFQFFCFSEVAGRTRTVEELDQTARGVKMGFLEHTVKSARGQGFNDGQVQAIKDEISRVFESELAAKLSAQRNVFKSRQTYALDELLSMRDRAVMPPGGLANIPYMPEPSNGLLRTGSSSLSQGASTFPRRVVASRGADKEDNERNTNFDKAQVARVRDAMDWVLGKTAPSKPDFREPKPASEEGQATVPIVEKMSASQEKGLQGSRWASGTSVVKAANFFTGPRYEKAWSKHSCLEELGQLQPQDKVTAGTEDLTDLYFPLPEDTNTQREPVKPRVPDVDGSPPPAATSSSYGASTPKRADKVETVTVGISRLSIRSPTAPQSKSDPPTTPTEQLGFAARTLREVCSQPASTAAQREPQAAQPKGKFNFYTPKHTRQ
ncbi:hypothetical protein MYCTH_92349 [Thermothelomyces thermophilus ATCC 42464]|uniref:Uncharacterized protein n=1 Tax=Thermothelomyces thermophilus (strain ATCC 42464 / BCRC 31852 / DSM 1799) TaxID=573729 RepID=G2Q8B2_THET4|nr:uncharacterized protein MYCTH_92349 [Thermothelomyces thermophilus ATCC 42464]AEO57015.1 hypothetical protein MYCTH_92349 [Thermothelomyces thermophilus ATCC 42464]